MTAEAGSVVFNINKAIAQFAMNLINFNLQCMTTTTFNSGLTQLLAE